MKIDRKRIYALTLGLLLICPPLQAAEFQGYRVTLRLLGENGRNAGRMTREVRDTCSGWELRDMVTNISHMPDGTGEIVRTRTESFESGDGLSYRFSFSAAGSGVETTTIAQAERERAADPWRLTAMHGHRGGMGQIETAQLSPDALFEVAYEHAMLRAFAAGRTAFSGPRVDVRVAMSITGFGELDYAVRLYADQRPDEAPAQPAMRSWRVEYPSPNMTGNYMPNYMGRRYGESGILLGQWMTMSRRPGTMDRDLTLTSELVEFAILPRDCPGG